MLEISGKEGLFLRFLLPLDERINIKLLLRVWGPRFELVVRLILVASFLDDSFRIASHFPEHTKQIGEQGCLIWMMEMFPEIARFIATAVVGLGLTIQVFGSLCLLALIQPDIATKALIGWTIAQPVLYKQIENVEFIAESLSLTGGLFMMYARIISEREKRDDTIVNSSKTVRERGMTRKWIAQMQLLGRLLLPVLYLYRAGLIVLSMFDHTLSKTVINAVMLCYLILSSTLVATGLRSRTIALVLALANLGYIFCMYPFMRFVLLDNGEWKFDETELRKYPIPHAALPINTSPNDFELWQIYDLHRYYFFHGLSVSGALLLLTQFGPGKIAVEENEPLLPIAVVQRAQD